MRIDFKELNNRSLPYLEAIIARRNVPYRKKRGHIEMLNPYRSDRPFGSFSVNAVSGVWKDFSTGEAGGDVISFCAFLDGTTQSEAARSLMAALGVRND